MKKELHLPQHLSHGVLFAAIALVVLFIVIPALRNLQSLPYEVYEELPVANTQDADRDMIPDYIDGTPSGSLHGSASDEAGFSSGD